MIRRTYIGVNLLLLLSALLGTRICNFKFTCGNIIRSDIRKILIDEGSVDQFLNEADKACFWTEFSIYKKIFVMVQHPLYSEYDFKLPFFNEYELFRNRVTGQFLLSTDLFYQDYFPSRRVSYLGYHNPYMSACSNPFIRSAYDSV